MRVYRQTSGFTTSIYRKPTHSNQYIHFFSWQPDHIKRSSIFSLLLRAYRLSDFPHLNPEIKFLYTAFQRVGFPTHVIDRVHGNVKRKFYGRSHDTSTSNASITEAPPPTISLPYNKHGMDFVQPVFKANGCRVVHTSTNTLKQSLVRHKPSDSVGAGDLGKAGVYRIPCSSCDRVYFGETGRDISTRIGEHSAAVRRMDPRNACYKHMSQTSHNIDWDNTSLIFQSEDWYQRLVVESACIVTKNNFNISRSTLAIDNLSAQLILASRPNLEPP